MNETSDNLKSYSYAQVLDLIAEGEIVGLVDGAKSIYLDDTAVQNPDGTYNFTGVSYVATTGTQNQAAVTGFDEVKNEIAVSVEVKVATGAVVRSISNSSVTSVAVTIQTPALTYQDNKGNIQGTTIQYAIDIQVDGGGWIEKVTDTVTGKTTSPYERQYRIKLPAGTTRQVRVRRLTPDSTSVSLNNKTFWKSYTEVVEAKLRYPNSAIVGLKFDATQFKSIPSRAYDVKLLKVRIPVNATVRSDGSLSYSGTWDGTFKIAWTTCPAWCYYDLITNERYGLGAYIDASQADKWSLYAISKYSNELIDDGFGGTEPRFSCNMILNTRQEAYTVLNQMASIFRGMSYWATGSVTTVQDAPKDPTYLFTSANVIDGVFNYQGSSAKARHTVALVTWNDPADMCRSKVEYVEDTAGIARYGIIEAPVTAVGCTSRGQAHRVGRWLLYSERFETEIISFKTGGEGALCAPGDIIKVQDQYRSGNRTGGRISAATSTTITVDAIGAPPSGTKTLYVIGPDGVTQTRTVASISGNVITVTAPFSPVPQAQYVWAMSGTAQEVSTYRVLSVVENENGEHEVTALEYDASKYALIESNLNLTDPGYTNLNPVPADPTGLVLAENTYEYQNTTRSKITASWNLVDYATYYLLQWRVDDGNFNSVNVYSNSYELLDTIVGTYEFRVYSVSAQDLQSGGFDTETITTVGNSAAPVAVTDLTATSAVGGVALKWTSSASALWQTEIYENTTNDSATATLLATVSANTYNRTGLTASDGIRYYWVKLVNTQSVRSAFSNVASATASSAANGASGAVVYIYQRAASTPALPTATVTYTFATGAVTGLDNGWTTTIPSGTNPLYVSTAAVSSNTATDTIAPSEWATPVVLAQNGSNGTNGTPGLNAATVFLYQRTVTGSAPSVSTAGSATYTFATGTITGQPSGWTTSIPSTSLGSYLWVIQATASSTSTTDTISNTEWSAPSLLNQNGTDGANGLNNAIVYLYQRATSTPSVPSTTVTFTFATYTATGVNNGWSQTIPAGTNPLYVTTASASSAGATDTIATNEWSSPTVLAQNGTDGANGLNSATVYLFQRTSGATAPSLPSASVTYTFATGAASGVNNGWTQTMPTTGGSYRWMTMATALSTSSTDTILSSEWAAAALIAQDGTNGNNGTNGTNGTNAVNALLTVPSVSLIAYANGTVLSFSTATGQIKVYSGTTDVTASSTFAVIAQSNCTGSVNASGTYSVTAMSGDTASLVMTATYAGTTITLTFALSKSFVGYEIVSALPSTNLFNGRVVYLSTDGKLYRYNGSSWTASVPTTDLSGTIADAQIAAVAAGKVTGQLTNSQIADVAAAKLTGQITSTQITDGSISTAKIAAGAVSTAKLAAGAVTADTIAANAITSAKIEAGAIVAGKIAAGAIAAGDIAAGAIVAGKIAANAVTATELATNAVTADKINAGAITAAKLATTELISLSSQLGNAVVDTIKIAGNAVTQPINTAAADIFVSTNITYSPGGYSCDYVFVGYPSGDYDFDGFSFYYVGPGLGAWTYTCGMVPGSFSGGQTAVETGWITVGEGGVTGGLIVNFYATYDGTVYIDAGQQLVLLMDTNNGSGYQVVGGTKVGAVTTSGDTRSIIPVVMSRAVTGLTSVRFKVMTGRYNIGSGGTLNSSYLRDINLSVMGAKR